MNQVDYHLNPEIGNTVVQDFNGHEVNRIHGLNGKKCYHKALYLVDNRHDFKGMHDFKGNFPYDDNYYIFHVVLQYIGIVQKKLILLALEENNQASLIVSGKNYNIS